MQARIDMYKAAPEAIQAMRQLHLYVEGSGLEHSLLELIKTRVSQINRCAYCVHLHTKDARKLGESEERLYLLSAWRESPLYTPRERAALAWAEALTDLPHDHVGDALHAEVAQHFTPAEQVKLTLAIATINAWNRFGVGFRLVHPGAAPVAAAAQ